MKIQFSYFKEAFWHLIQWRHFKKISFAVGLAVAAMAISYFCTNLNYPLSGEKMVLRYWCTFTNRVTSEKEKDNPDNVVFINISHDKELVKVTDEYDIPVGESAITDRRKLLYLLETIDSVNSYQYVMLDVFFEDGYRTNADSALFAKINCMERLVVPRHSGALIDVDVPFDKTAYADYNTSISENDFTKYPLFSSKGESMPLRMYSDISGKAVKRFLMWYSDDGSLSRKVIFPKMHIRINSPYRLNGQKAFYNLGADILSYKNDIDWGEFFANKIIVIGAFEGDDIHTTYTGDLPGSLINYNVFLSLMKGQHKIPLGLIALYFLIFFAMSSLILRKHYYQTSSWAWVWAKLFVLYSIILIVVCIIVFELWGQAHDVFITSTFFSFVDTVFHRIIIKKKKYAKIVTD